MTRPHPLGPADAAHLVLDAIRRGDGIVVALILDGPDTGHRRAVTEGEGWGLLSTPEQTTAVDALARDALRGQVTLGRRDGDAGTLTLPGGARVYLERTLPPAPLLVVGAGHLATPLARLGALLGYRVTVADDRPAFARSERFPEAEKVLRVDFSDPFRELVVGPRHHVLLVTRGHRYDYECLRRLLLLPEPPRYIGMIGSRRRVRATFHQLREEGFDGAALARIRAPVGLDLGAETPEEIAVAVAAELVLVRRGGTGAPLTERERVAERFFSHSGEVPL